MPHKSIRNKADQSCIRRLGVQQLGVNVGTEVMEPLLCSKQFLLVPPAALIKFKPMRIFSHPQFHQIPESPPQCTRSVLIRQIINVSTRIAYESFVNHLKSSKQKIFETTTQLGIVRKAMIQVFSPRRSSRPNAFEVSALRQQHLELEVSGSRVMKGWWGGEQGDLVVYDFIFKAIIYIYRYDKVYDITYYIFFIFYNIYIYTCYVIYAIYIYLHHVFFTSCWSCHPKRTLEHKHKIQK